MATYDYSKYYKTKTQSGYDIYESSGKKLSYEQALPMFQTGFNVDFIQESKPTLPQVQATQAPVSPQNPQGATQPPVQPQQPVSGQNQAPQGQPDATVAQAGQQPLQQGGKFGTQNFGRIGDDVVEIMSDGSQRKVSEAEFNNTLKARGLNLDVLPQIEPTSTFSGAEDSGKAGDGPDGEVRGEDLNGDGKPDFTPTSFIEDYSRIIKELGLTDIKAKFTEIQGKYQELTDKKRGEIDEINNDPWLSEGQKRARVGKIEEKYEDKESNLTNQLKLTEALYDEGLSQVRYIVSGLQEDRNKLLDLALKREEAQSKLAQQGFENKLDLLKLQPSALKPIEVSPGASLFDPVTKTKIFTAPTTKQITGGVGTGTKIGTTGATVKLTASQQGDVADMKTLLSQLEQIETSDLKGAVGFFTGPLESAALKYFGAGNQKDAQVRAIIGNVKAQLAKLRGGTSFTINEQKLLESYVPSINESPESIVAKVRALKTYVTSKLNQTLSAAGGVSSGGSNSDPLGLFK